MPAEVSASVDMGRWGPCCSVAPSDRNMTTPCFTLPAGLRPSATLQFPVRCGTGVVSYVSINSSGAVVFGGVLADGQAGITLDGISFDTR